MGFLRTHMGCDYISCKPETFYRASNDCHDSRTVLAMRAANSQCRVNNSIAGLSYLSQVQVLKSHSKVSLIFIEWYIHRVLSMRFKDEWICTEFIIHATLQQPFPACYFLQVHKNIEAGREKKRHSHDTRQKAPWTKAKDETFLSCGKIRSAYLHHSLFGGTAWYRNCNYFLS